MELSSPSENDKTGASKGVGGGGRKLSGALDITPSPTLHFIHRHDTQEGTQSPKCTITLRHPDETGNDIAFKIKTSNQHRYLVQPNKGFVAPGTSQTVDILLHHDERTFSPILNTPRDVFHVEICPYSSTSPDPSVDQDAWSQAILDGTFHQTTLYAVHDLLPHDVVKSNEEAVKANEAPARAKSALVKSNEEPVKANEAPARAKSALVKSNEEPVEANEAPARAKSALVKSNEEPVEANEAPARAKSALVKSNDEPMGANLVPARTNEPPARVKSASAGVNPTPVRTNEALERMDEAPVRTNETHARAKSTPATTANEAPIRTSEALVRTNEALKRTNEALVRTNEVLARTNEVLVRENERLTNDWQQRECEIKMIAEDRGKTSDSILTRLSKFTLSPRVEVTLRIGLSMLIANSLAVVDLPNATPVGLTQLIGIFGSIFSILFPHCPFIIAAAFPTSIVGLLIAFLGATILLSAATVGDGLLVFVYFVMAFYISSLNYGPNVNTTWSLAGTLLVATGMTALSSWQLVQNGLAVNVSLPTDGGGDFNATMTEHHYLSDLLVDLEEVICGGLSNVTDTTCADAWAVLLPPGVAFTIPGDSNFAGQTAIVSCANYMCTLTIPGGMWMVKGFWTWHGVDNPLAAYQNTLIVICWSLVCASIGILFPPIRTFRRMFSRGVLPMAISEATSYIELTNAEVHSKINGSKDDTMLQTKQSSSSTPENTKVLVRKLIHNAIQTAKGGKSALTSYEPRLCGGHPLELTWPKLKKLTICVHNLTIHAIGSKLRTSFSERETEEDRLNYAEDIKILKECSSALKSLDGKELFGAELASTISTDDTTTTVDEEQPESKSSKDKTFSFFVRYLNRTTKELKSCTETWLDAMNHPKYTGFKDALMSYLPWIVPTINLLKALAFNLLLPFQPKRWNLLTFIIALKYTLGITFLLIAEVYWKKYRDFAIEVNDESNAAQTDSLGPVTLTIDDTPNIYAGWNLLGYVFATTPTMEGTMKKGVFRVMGTLLGGFTAWLGIIICSGSYDETSPVNLYAFVFWLTITNTFVAYLITPEGPAAFMGLEQNRGFLEFYFVLTQSLCGLEIAMGIGMRDTIIANRIVATITGVLMAMLVAVIPPHYKGSDIKPFKALLGYAKTTFVDGLRLVIEHDKADKFIEHDKSKNKGKTKMALEKLIDDFTTKGNEDKIALEFKVKDALKHNGAPVFKVDPRLPATLDTMTITGIFIVMWLEFAAHVVEDEGKLSNDDFAVFRDKADKIVERLERMKSENGEKAPVVSLEEVDGDNNHSLLNQIGSENEEPDLLLNLAIVICMELEKMEAYLSELDGDGDHDHRWHFQLFSHGMSIHFN